ncbi:type VII secretion protein EccB [Microbacterium resistens]|uniref:Type VII secretion protein EccB n=1 Tax=Microbacterium resistens TaxID=156977 RepID=A0ABY3RQR4_9MICO|nr:type VII secretion protein EccB [Microbacterium resistens]UGS25298.1 type VII secretion protein EccB [Microbacterium resistens]
MATKKELIEAQGFSRRRLLSAFTGGAPGGKELEPAKPLRAVAAGIALTAMLLLGGLFFGMLRPGLPQGWENNRLIIATDTGARYVSVEGVLHPVINTASARLLIPAKEFSVVSTDKGTLEGIEVGAPIGILGAPDDLPAPGSLHNTGWTACVDQDAGAAVSVAASPIATAQPGAGVVVRRDGDLFVIAGGLRYAVPADEADAVLRAAGLGTAGITRVDGRWLNLFPPGRNLSPIVLRDVGTRIPDSDLVAGEIVHVQGRPADERYVITSRGEAAPLTPLAFQLYLLGSGATAGPEREVTPAELAALPTGSPAGGDDWPAEPLTALAEPLAACALLDDEGRTVLAATGAELPADRARPAVAIGSGALVRVGDGEAAAHVLVDESGTAYAIPDGAEAVDRLGYTTDQAGPVPESWLAYFAGGPALAIDAAGRTPASDG